MEEKIYRMKDGWFNKPDMYKKRKKTKDAEMYRCPSCGLGVQIKTKVWTRSTRPGGFSIATRPQCDGCQQSMTEVEIDELSAR